MDVESFHDYVERFNNRDYDGFGGYYADDVVFELGDRKRLEGREAILDFYREVHERVRESLDVNHVVTSDTRVAAELDTEFRAIEDAPDFVAGPLEAGESFRIVSFVHYHVANGKFTHVKSARFQTDSK